MRLALAAVVVVVMYASAKPHSAHAAEQAGWTAAREKHSKRTPLRKDVPHHAAFWFGSRVVHTRVLMCREAVHLSVPPLHRHRKQLHCPAHKSTLWNAATLSCDVPKVVHEPHRLLAHVPARLNRKRHKPECSMIRHILLKQRPLGLFSPRRSPPSCHTVTSITDPGAGAGCKCRSWCEEGSRAGAEASGKTIWTCVNVNVNYLLAIPI